MKDARTRTSTNRPQNQQNGQPNRRDEPAATAADAPLAPACVPVIERLADEDGVTDANVAAHLATRPSCAQAARDIRAFAGLVPALRRDEAAAIAPALTRAFQRSEPLTVLITRYPSA